MFDVGYIFPGQGAQYVGMGKAWAEQYPLAQEVFKSAEKVLDLDLRKLCFEGPEIELSRTENAQPAILVTSIAILKVFESQFKDIFHLCAVAGLSLGEYSALVAAHSISFLDAVRVTRARGRFMEEASLASPGRMASLMGLDIKSVEQICFSSGAEIANLNCPGQIVISGTIRSIDKAVRLAETAGGKKAVVLNVSGPFHSRLMRPAAEKLKEVLEDIKISEPQVPFISNVKADYLSSPKGIKDALVEQVRSRTRWADSIDLIKSKGITTFLEIGPGRVLKGLLGRIDRELKVYNISEPEDLEEISNIVKMSS